MRNIREPAEEQSQDPLDLPAQRSEIFIKSGHCKIRQRQSGWYRGACFVPIFREKQALLLYFKEVHMQITKELVSYVAQLSRIKLDDSETEEMQRQMGAIVDYMDILNQLDTENIEPLSHIFSITNVMRDDVIAPSYPREEILANAPEHTDEAFVVPKTVE